MDMLIVSALLIGLAILVAFIGLGRAIEVSTPNRLEDYIGDQSFRQLRTPQRPAGLGGSVDDLVQGFDKVLRSVSAGDKIAQLLRRANLPWTVTEFLMIELASTVGLLLIGYLLSHAALATILLGLVGLLIPYLIVRSRHAARLRAFNEQLHNVLMQLAGSMRAGYGLLQAIDFVAHEMPAPAGEELATVVRDVKLGRTLLDALDDLIDRIDSTDMAMVVVAIRIHHETGGNLAEILDTVSETIRERVRIKGELRALTAQQRIAGYVLGALPILVFLVLMVLNPSYESRLFVPGPTLCIPIGALISMVAGFLVIRRIVAIEL